MDTDTHDTTPQSAGLTLCIDVDGPSCHWPERWFSTDLGLFGCPKCAYTSADRDA
jgi:hypothetical protein